MIYETLTAAEFAPALADSGAILNTYARPQEGFLGEDGGRWGVLILPGGGYGMSTWSSLPRLIRSAS